MKAVRLYNPGDLRVEEVEIPKIKPDEALVKVIACGVCGSDIPRVNKYGAHVAPITIGHEFSGEIVEIGKELKGFKKGDLVGVPPLMPCYKCRWCEKGLYSLCDNYDYFGSRRDGAMAEYVAVPQSNMMKVSKKVDPLAVATFDPCANAVHAITLAGMKAGETICVYGVGPIGLFAVQCAKVFGAKTVIAVDVLDEKLAIAKELGADYIINSKTTDAPAKVRELTDGGADVVLDITGAPPAQLAAIESCQKTGRMVFVGISHQGLNLSEKHVDSIMRRQLSILGSWNSFKKEFPGFDWFETQRLFEKGLVTAEKVISHKLPLDDAPEMFKKIAAGGLFFNKILFIPSLSK